MSKARKSALRDIIILTHEYPPFRGGIGTYCEQIAAAAARLGHRVTVWAPRFGAAGARAGEGANPGIRRFTGGVFKHFQFPRVLLLALCAISSARNSHILAADWPFVAACGLLRRVLLFRYRIMLHGSEILFFRTSRLLNLLTFGNPFYGAEMIFANSHFTRDLLLKTYPNINPAIVHVTYLGMDDFWLNSKPEPDAALLDRLNIPAGNQIILTVGRLHPRKGQARTMAAISALPAKLRRKITYVMVGNAVDDDYHAELSRLAQSANFQAIIASGLGNTEVRSLYGMATAYCMPSVTRGTKVEGFGLVFLEAAGSSLPSIAVRAGAVPEVVKDAETGILIPSDAEMPLAEALEKILTDSALRARLGANALKWARTFTWQRCAEQTFTEPR